MVLRPYDRRAAVLYAHEWAYGRNPKFYDYERIGGDCTNFASQCLYAGSGIMDFTPTYGWYYIDADRKAPAWTGVAMVKPFWSRAFKMPWERFISLYRRSSSTSMPLISIKLRSFAH